MKTKQHKVTRKIMEAKRTGSPSGGPESQTRKSMRKDGRLNQPNPNSSRAAVNSNSDSLLIADWVKQRQAARFLARLRRAVLPLAVIFVTCAAWAKTPALVATLEPLEIALGESAQLTVTVNGQDETPPELPSVNGLSFQPVGQSSQIQIINGAMSAILSHTYTVTPSRPGTFTIPAIKVGSGRSVGATEPLVFTVLKHAGATSLRGGTGHSQPVLPAPAINASEEEISAAERDSFGFLRIASPKNEFYVGELVPVEVKACFRAGVELRVDGLPRLNSDAFTMNKLGDHPQRSQQIIGGVPYTVFTWSTAITAVKAGDYEMSVEIPTTVTMRQRAQRPRARTANPFGDSFFDDVFNDSFFQGFFGTATQKEVALSSRPSAVKILSLPTENRPAGFAGAVGKFEVSAEVTHARANAGDPVTLKFKVMGSGNFDRVSAPEFVSNEDWKTYNPSSRFEPEDNVGFAGAKSFEQSWVPTRGGQLEIPSLAFSFFDPERKEYVSRSHSPILIEVASGQNVSATLPKAVGCNGNAPTTPPAVASVGGSSNEKLACGNSVAVQRPWILNPWFTSGTVLPSLALFAAYPLIRRQQKRACDPNRLRAEETRRTVRERLKVMENAAQQGDATEFLTAARGALQQKLGLIWDLPPQTINLAEVNARMNGAAEGFRFIFEIADEVAYTGLRIPAADLREWSRIVNTEINRLEKN